MKKEYLTPAATVLILIEQAVLCSSYAVEGEDPIDGTLNPFAQ